LRLPKVEKHVLRAEGVTAETWDRERAGISPEITPVKTPLSQE
jgi:hypothetical protein